MKLLLLISLLGLVACGGDYDVEDNGKGALGSERKFETLTVNDPNSKELIRRVCEALSHKQSLDLVNYSINLSYSKRGCGESDFGAPVSGVYPIRRESGSYIFKDFVIPDVETESEGIMRGICFNLRNSELATPFEDEAGKAVNFRPLVGTTACGTTNNQVCMLVEKGEISSDGSTYKVHTVHTVTFNTSGSYRGFYKERTIASNSMCASGKTMEQKVIANF